MINESLLRLTVEEDLAAFQTQNAVFVAEKLVAGFPTPESKHLLARAYLQANDTQRAFCTLYPASTPKNRLKASARRAFATRGLVTAPCSVLTPRTPGTSSPSAPSGSGSSRRRRWRCRTASLGPRARRTMRTRTS